MTKIILFFVLTVPNQQPQVNSQEMTSVDECLAYVTHILKTYEGQRPPGTVQVGCLLPPDQGA